MAHPSSDVAFSPSVKAVQSARGSRTTYAKMEAHGGFRTMIDEGLVQFLMDVDTAYLATANLEGQPYAQHRGGPKGFIRVIDEHTLGFVDFAGNRQFISMGNLAENPKAFLFLMDYAHRRRIKLWGRAKVGPAEATLLEKLLPKDYQARPEQVILFEVDAWDVNCPQHIPQKFAGVDVAKALSELESTIAELKDENAELKRKLNGV